MVVVGVENCRRGCVGREGCGCGEREGKLEKAAEYIPAQRTHALLTNMANEPKQR